jgi:hypothetical protein
VGEELSSLRAYKLKTDGILGEMMERMRRDAEERAELERALAVAQRSCGDLAARHEAAGRRLVGTMDALREAEEREAGMAAALEQQRQHESALEADLHGARRQLYEQQQGHAAAKAAVAAAAASPARDSLGGGEQLAEQLAAARARIVELERGTRADAARETEAAAAAEAAGAEHQRRHAQARAVGAALRGAVADLQGALKQAQAALCAERAARASAGQQQMVADMGSALGGEGGAFSATSAAAAAEAWGKEDPEGTWQQQERDAAALAGTDASAAAEAAMAAVERGASPPPTSHADSSVFFFFHMTVQAALAEAAGRSTRLGCNTPLVDSEAMFREATAQSDMLAMHEWPQWIRAKVQARFQTAALSGGSEAPGSEAPSDVSGGAGWGSDRESEDGTGSSAAEQGSDDGLALARAALAEDDGAATEGTGAAVHSGGSRMAAAAEAALQDVSGFICPVCYDTFASADTLLAHHGTHRALMLHTSSDESSGDESDHSFSRAPAERVYTSMRDLQMAGDLDALGDGPQNSPLSSPSVTPPDSPSALLRGLAASAQTLTETFGT